MRRFSPTLDRDERGAVAVMFGIMAAMLLIFCGMVVDLGLARDRAAQSQNAADASALAAANVLYPANSTTPNFAAATAAAKNYATTNFGTTAAQWASCTDASALAYQPAGTPCISYDSSTSPTTVRVKIPMTTVNTSFGGLAGVNKISIARAAQAGVTNPLIAKCSLCFLGGVSTQNTDFSVTGGSIAVGGSISVNSQSYWTATNGQIYVGGSVSGSGNFSPAYTTTQPIPDPFASMAMPTVGTLAKKTNPCASGSTGGPGIYGAYSFPKNTCTLQAGLYVIVGTWSESNNSVIAGTGVTLYFTCGTVTAPHTCTSSDTSGGMLDGSNGALSISAGAFGSSPSWAIVYDRLNPNPLSLQGNGSTQITGGVYAPHANLALNGTSGYAFSGGPVVVGSGTYNGGGNHSTISVSNANDVPIYGTPGVPRLTK